MGDAGQEASVQKFVVLPVVEKPFPHVVADHYLEPDLYNELVAAFPDCPSNSGPTGYSYFWGDPEYDELLARSGAWRALFERVHSQQFVDYALAQFRAVFTEQCLFDLSHARYVPYRESRFDKERGKLARVEHAPDELWVRLDILQGRMGYDRAPHLDHRRRAATMLIYFCDSEENGMVGGDLVLHGRTGAEKRIVRPRHNRMAMFPCHNGSLHSVPAVTAQRRPRNFVQITVSSSVDLWQPVRRSIFSRVVNRARSLVGRARQIGN
jgi:2OG-Fe(II) oxygenase superfamily